MANYAWTEILGDEGKVVKLGDTVTAADVGGKEELERLKAEGVIRSSEYPAPLGSPDSPVDFRLRELRKQMEDAAAGTDQAVTDFAMSPDMAPKATVEEVK